MEKTILFPFSITEDNNVSYKKTLDLAEKIKAKVVCFTVVPEVEYLDDAYLHLLALNGYYQTISNGWESPKIHIEKAIKVGDMEDLLSQYLRKEYVDVLIDLSPVATLKKELIGEWLKENNYERKIFNF